MAEYGLAGYANKGSNTSAPFNMAIDTLMRLGRILDKITLSGIDPTISINEKQAIKVYLVRQFFVQSSPLLEPEIVERYAKELDSFIPSKTTFISMRSGQAKKKETRNYFDPLLESKLDSFLLVIQRELQKERYFMPPKSDPRVGWKLE